MEKRELRRRIRELKKEYSSDIKKDMSGSVWQQVEADDHFRKAETVLAYWSMEDEVYTHEFVCKWAKEKTVLLPCVNGGELDIRYFEGPEKLCPGEGYAIPEPVGALCTDLSVIDVIIVPGVAFDAKGNRLGRGKGYYDKILKRTQAYTIGVCFDFQMQKEVPTDEQDVKMSKVICSC